MNAYFKYRILTIIVFSTYIFWGSFGVDLTLHPTSERIPLHRVFILLTAFIFLFNVQQVINACLKNKLLISLIIYILFSAGWAENGAAVIKNFIFLSSSLIISIMTALAYNNNKPALIRRLFWLFLLMVLASILTALYFPKVGINTLDFGKPRWIGISAHPNGLGTQALALVWLSSNLFFLSKSTVEKAIIICAVIAAFFTIVKADSMTSLITSLIVLSYTCYCYILGKMSMSVKFGVFFIVIMVLFFIGVFYMNATEMTDAAMESTGRDTSFTGRSILWEKGLSAVADNLIFGYGFDDLEQLTKKYHIVMSHLHNGYVETLVKGGLIASMLLFVILVKTFINQLIIKSTHKQEFVFLSSGLIIVLLHNVTESSILRGLSTLGIFLIFIIVSTSLVPQNYIDNSSLKDQ